MSSVLFPAQLKPTGLFPTHEDSFGKGGFVALTGDASSLSSEDIIQDFLNTNIIQQRRKEGMLVYISSLKQYYTCTSITGDSGISGDWSRQYFSGRYFYGATAPTAGADGGNLLTGDKWFNTVVGSEFTFLPLTVSGDNVWVDIDQLGGGDGSLSEIVVDGITYSSVSSLNFGSGENVTLDSSIDESSLSITFGIDITTVVGPTGPTGPPGSGKYFYGSTAPTVGEDGLTLGSKWFDNIVGSEFTYLPSAEGSSSFNWVDIDHLGSVILEDQFVNISGDTMTGTLTGTDISLTGSLTTDKAFRNSNDEEFVNNEFITKNYYETNDFYVKKSGDTMSGSLTADKAFRNSNDEEFVNNEFITKQYAENNFIGGATGFFSGGHRSFRLYTDPDFNLNYSINPLTDIGYPGPYSIAISFIWQGIFYQREIFNAFSGTDNFVIRIRYDEPEYVIYSNANRTLTLTNGPGNNQVNHLVTIGPYR